MLKSYEYSETNYLDISLRNKIVFEKEKALAKDFVKNHPSKVQQYSVCPICGRQETEYFFNKWGVNYVICKSCFSIFADCNNQVVQQYINDAVIRDYRLDNFYQEQSKIRRSTVWQEFIDWLEVRSFRFLKKNKGLSILDYGNRYKGFVELLQNCNLCGKYELRNSILNEKYDHDIKAADIVLYLNCLQNEVNPLETLINLKSVLSDEGLLVVSTRVGSGFDILTLKGMNDAIYPYEHILLPSMEGIILLLEKAGYKVVEISTPGLMDVNYVLEQVDKIEDDLFVKYLIKKRDKYVLQDFQKFLQKAGLSSFAQIIAKKDCIYEK